MEKKDIIKKVESKKHIIKGYGNSAHITLPKVLIGKKAKLDIMEGMDIICVKCQRLLKLDNTGQFFYCEECGEKKLNRFWNNKTE